MILMINYIYDQFQMGNTSVFTGSGYWSLLRSNLMREHVKSSFLSVHFTLLNTSITAMKDEQLYLRQCKPGCSISHCSWLDAFFAHHISQLLQLDRMRVERLSPIRSFTIM